MIGMVSINMLVKFVTLWQYIANDSDIDILQQEIRRNLVT